MDQTVDNDNLYSLIYGLDYLISRDASSVSRTVKRTS